MTIALPMAGFGPKSGFSRAKMRLILSQKDSKNGLFLPFFYRFQAHFYEFQA
jgi:hypothetical protein